MNDTLAFGLLGGLYILAIAISAYLAFTGPPETRRAPLWCLLTLATFGAAAGAYVLVRQREAKRVAYPPDEYRHETTDEAIRETEDRAAVVEEKIDEVDAKGHWEDGELGSDMARRLDDG